MSYEGPAGQPSVTPPPPPPAAGVSPNRNVMIVLSYLWLLALVPLISEKEDKEVQWHAKHGLVLLVAEVIFWVAWHIVTSLIVTATAGFGCFIYLLSPLFALAILALHIFCIVKGVNGQRLVIPVLSSFADKF